MSLSNFLFIFSILKQKFFAWIFIIFDKVIDIIGDVVVVGMTVGLTPTFGSGILTPPGLELILWGIGFAVS